MKDPRFVSMAPSATGRRRKAFLDWLLGPRRRWRQFDLRSLATLRSLCFVTLAVAGCDSAKARFGDMALPADCEARCPVGYSCDNGTCVGGSAQALDFDITTFPVAGNLTVDGQPPTASSSCSGNQVNVGFSEGELPKSFFDPIVGTLVEAPLACSDADGAVATRLPAGHYRVLASRADTNTTFPTATITLQSKLDVSAAASALTWNIATVPVSGVITIDGLPPVAGSGCQGNHVDVNFVDDSGGSFSTSIPCGESTGAFSARVAPGNYRVLANRADTNTTFPNATIVVKSSFQVSGAATGLAWNVTTVPVSGVVTIDGQPPVAGTGCQGNHVDVNFVDDSGASFSTSIACGVASGAFSARVAAGGSYRVLANRADTNTTFPNATVVLQRSFSATSAASNLAWNVVTVPVSGVITLDGQPPVAGTGCQGNHVDVNFVDGDGASFSTSIACGVASGAFATRVAAGGTYRVLANRADTNTTFPDATITLKSAFAASAAASNLSWNVVTVPVGGHVLVDGQAPLAGTGCVGDQVSLSFFDAAGARYSYSIPCSDSTGAFSLRMATGTYHVLASRADTHSSFPDATLTLVNAVAIQ